MWRGLILHKITERYPTTSVGNDPIGPRGKSFCFNLWKTEWHATVSLSSFWPGVSIRRSTRASPRKIQVVEGLNPRLGVVYAENHHR